MSIKSFVVTNNTGMTVVALYVAPSNGEGWGDELLDGNRIKNGRSYLVEVEGNARIWDISYTFIKKGALNDDDTITSVTVGHTISEIKTITITYDGRRTEPLTELVT